MGQSTFDGLRCINGLDIIASKDAVTDLGLDRESSTLLAVTNGTAGTYRDLKVRTITTTSGFEGNLTGNVTGNLTGNVTGTISYVGTLSIAASGANPITLSTNGSEWVRVTSAGKVGIGTAAPAASLDILKDQDALTYLSITNNTNGTGAVVRMQANSASSALSVFAASASYTGVGEFAGKSGIYTGSSFATSNLVVAATGATAGVDIYAGGNGATHKKLSITSAGAVTVYNPLASTGVSLLAVRAGAGQSAAPLQQWIANDGTTILAQVFSDGTIGISTKTPASAAATGTAGQVAWDADYIYIATATNTWKRAAISTWP